MSEQPEEQPLVLVHGWGMNAAVWSGLGDLAGRKPHPLELPGHGQMPYAPHHRDLGDWAVACLARAPEKAVWMGWSLGGMVALQAALMAPQRVSALVLLNSTPRFVQAADWSCAMPEATLTQFHDALLADPAATLERFLALQVKGSEDARETLRLLKGELAERPVPDPAALAVGLDLLREEDLRGPLPDIQCPTLWLFGERDTLVPAAAAERIEIQMPDARTAIIPGAAHAPFLSHSHQTKAAIADFLAEHS